MPEASEKDGLFNEDRPPVAYTRRWYMALIFASLSCLQGAMCVVWLVVAESSEAAFGWTNSDLSIMNAWTYVTYLMGMVPFSWLMQTKGMRVSTLVATVFTFLGTLFRIISFSSPVVSWFAHLGQICNGISGPVLFSGAPVISAIWFPPDQRATATAIMTVYSLSGLAFIFLIEPYVVPPPVFGEVDLFYPNESMPLSPNVTKFGIALLLLATTLIYFPAKPPSAPSLSATVDKLAFKTGLRQLFSCNKINFWCIVIPSAISVGLFGAYRSMLDINLKETGSSQITAGWLCFSGTIGSSITGIVLGRLGDKFVGHRKKMLLIMNASGAISVFTFALIIDGYIPHTEVGLYASYLVLAAATDGALPLYYEACIETTFPVAEGVSMGVITMSYNILPIAFLMVPLVPDIGTAWMNWVMFGAQLLCVPLLIAYKEKYDRLSMDNEGVHNDYSINH